MNYTTHEDFIEKIMEKTLGFLKEGTGTHVDLTRFEALRPYFVVFTILNESLHMIEPIVSGLDMESKILFDKIRNSALKDR